MTNSHTTVLDMPVIPEIPAGMLAGMNRRRTSSKLHESLNHEYYFKPDGWITCAEGHETIQAQHLIERKGFTRVMMDLGSGRKGASPRPTVNAEMAAPFAALLRHPDGPAKFGVVQIIAHQWHKRPPVIFVCREALSDDYHPEHTQDCWKRVEFRQLRGLEIEEATCNVCRAYFASVAGSEGMPAPVMLKKHQEVSHTRMMQNNDIAEKLAETFASMGRAPGSPSGLSTEDVIKIATAVAVAVTSNKGLPATPHEILENMDPLRFDEPVPVFNPEPVGDEVEGANIPVTSFEVEDQRVVAQPLTTAELEDAIVAPRPKAKPLKDMNRAELEAFAAERSIDITGCETNAQINGRIREALAPKAEQG